MRRDKTETLMQLWCGRGNLVLAVVQAEQAPIIKQDEQGLLISVGGNKLDCNKSEYSDYFLK